jgi:hypothetical protein
VGSGRFTGCPLPSRRSCCGSVNEALDNTIDDPFCLQLRRYPPEPDNIRRRVGAWKRDLGLKNGSTLIERIWLV